MAVCGAKKNLVEPEEQVTEQKVQEPAKGAAAAPEVEQREDINKLTPKQVTDEILSLCQQRGKAGKSDKAWAQKKLKGMARGAQKKFLQELRTKWPPLKLEKQDSVSLMPKAQTLRTWDKKLENKEKA